MSEALYTDIEVAELLGTRRAVVQSWRLSGALTFLKGRPVLMTEQAVLDFIGECERNALIPSLVTARRDFVEDPRTWALQQHRWRMIRNMKVPKQKSLQLDNDQ